MASHTERLVFGPLVTPASFRHPVFTARFAASVDDLSNGRFHLGVGAGWQKREHEMFGFDLLDIDARFERFEESLQVIRALLSENGTVDFDGNYYELKEAKLLPKPKRHNGPPLTIGGNGKKKTLPLVVKYADEWNAVYIPYNELVPLTDDLFDLMEKAGREKKSLRRSLMTNLTYAKNSKVLNEKLNGRDIEEMKNKGIIVGHSAEVIEQLKSLESIGIDEIMLQWLDLEDFDGLENFAINVLPHFSSSG